MYSQITVDERYTLGLLRRLGLRPADIARALGRHRSTVGRELARNTRPDGGYRPAVAQERTNARRWRSRGGERFTSAEFALVTARLALKWSPEQIAAVLRQSACWRSVTRRSIAISGPTSAGVASCTPISAGP